jgi:hypothetical protein
MPLRRQNIHFYGNKTASVYAEPRGNTKIPFMMTIPYLNHGVVLVQRPAGRTKTHFIPEAEDEVKWRYNRAAKTIQFNAVGDSTGSGRVCRCRGPH